MHNCRPQYVERLRKEAAGQWRRRCAAIASGARRPIRCACWIARCRSGPADHRRSCRPFMDHLCDACRAHFDAVQAVSGRPRHRVRGAAAAWCAAWITTCARRSKWCTARWARRIRCWAAAATTGWRNRSARRCTAPGIGFSIGEDRLVMTRGRRASRPTPLDLFIAPLGEPALRHAAVMARDLPARRALGGTGGRQAEARHGAGQQAGRALHADRGRQRNGGGPLRAEEYGHRRAAGTDAATKSRRRSPRR